MENPARLFHCARCQRQVVICSRCDRGQRYCSRACSQRVRREAQRAAGRRYQESHRGRRRHAERQRRYRRRREKVTHQGSPPTGADAPLVADVERTAPEDEPERRIEAAGEPRRCRFCGRLCALFLRLGFIRRRSSAPSRTLDPDTPQ